MRAMMTIAPVGRHVAAGFCVTAVLAVATMAGGAAQAPAPKAASSPKPTPSPCPSPFLERLASADAGVSLRGARENAQFCITTTTHLPVAVVPGATPTPTAAPTPTPPPGATSAPTATPKPVTITLDDKGLTVKYKIDAGVPLVTKRKVNGVPMVEPTAGMPGEDRFELTVGSTDPARKDHFVTVVVNADSKCYLTGLQVRDPDQHAACMAPSPTPSPAPAASPSATTPAPPTLLAGTVTVPLGFLGSTLDPKPGVQQFYLCYAHRSSALPFTDPAYVAEMKKAGTCEPFNVVILDGSGGVYRVAGQAGDANQKSSSASSSGGDASSAALRSALARHESVPTGASNSAQQSNKGTSVGAFGTFVHPFSFSVRGSMEVQNNSLFSSIDKQTQRYLSDFSATQATITPSGLNVSESPSTSDNFPQIDVDILQRVVPRPYRGYQETGAAPKSELKAFDATNLLDLKPFDPSHIKEVTYGGKLTWLPTDAAFGLGYYRDRVQGATGTILHGDGTFGNVTFGASEVIANTQTPSSNKYVTALHTANTVVGALGAFGRDNGWKTFVRFGSVATGNDWLGTISYAEPGAGRILDDDGTTLRHSMLLGYRAIDARYDPLATQYDIFAGNQMAFARLGSSLTRWGKTPRVYETTLSLARAANGGIPSYSNVGLTHTIPLYDGLSLDLVAARSTMAGSVAARQSGKFVVTGAPAATLLDNDTATANLSYQTSTVQLKLGESLTHSPSCDSATSCTSPFAHALTGSASVVSGYWLVNGNIQPGSTQTNNPGGTSIASNQIVRSYLAAYHVCHVFGTSVGMEPSLVYKNNISEDTSAFTPGNLIEEDVDIGALNGAALRLSYKRAADQHWLPTPLTGNAFSFAIVSSSQTLWQTNKKIDPCIAREKNNNQPKPTLKTAAGMRTP